MKSFIRVKKINGQEYLYEITPYYDKEKKQIRQKSKYLGKNVNGVPIRVRSQDQITKESAITRRIHTSIEDRRGP